MVRIILPAADCCRPHFDHIHSRSLGKIHTGQIQYVAHKIMPYSDFTTVCAERAMLVVARIAEPCHDIRTQHIRLSRQSHIQYNAPGRIIAFVHLYGMVGTEESPDIGTRQLRHHPKPYAGIDQIHYPLSGSGPHRLRTNNPSSVSHATDRPVHIC